MIKIDNLTYRYETSTDNELENIDLTIEPGEFIVVTGRSGCGKTTLSKCINGLIPYFHEGDFSGDVFIDGLNTKDLSLHEIGEKVGSVFQDPRSQFFTTDTTDEVAFGCQNLGLPRADIINRLDEAFRDLNIEQLRDRNIFRISSGEKQKIAIASCRAMRPLVYLFDEPSSNLDPSAIEQLAQVLGRLKAQGYTIIIMEHRLYYMRELADRILYMDEGVIKECFTVSEYESLPDETRRRMGLRTSSLDKVLPGGEHVVRTSGPRMEVRGLSFSYSKKRRKERHHGQGSGRHPQTGPVVIENACFNAAGGEIIGIIGKNGAGKTTLLKLLCGLLKEQDGEVLLDGRSCPAKDRIRRSYFVMQDSDYQLFEDSLLKELKLGNGKAEDLDARCFALLDALGLSAYSESHPASLSRGQKQRVTIACGIISGADLLFFDEPTSGLDGGSMENVASLISSLAKEGKLVFIVSHDYEFLLSACTRIINLSERNTMDDFNLNGGTRARFNSLFFQPSPAEAWV